MTVTFSDSTVSIALVYRDDLPYERAAFHDMLRAALAQDLPPAELLVVDVRGAAASVDFVPGDWGTDVRGPIRHLPGTYANRAAMCNAALAAARGEFLLMLYN